MYFQLLVVNFMLNFQLTLVAIPSLTIQILLLVGNEQQPSCWPWPSRPWNSVGQLNMEDHCLIDLFTALSILTCIRIPLLKPGCGWACVHTEKEPQGWGIGPLCWLWSGSSHLVTWDSSTLLYYFLQLAGMYVVLKNWTLFLANKIYIICYKKYIIGKFFPRWIRWYSFCEILCIFY
jgi:hypothetical protein